MVKCIRLEFRNNDLHIPGRHCFRAFTDPNGKFVKNLEGNETFLPDELPLEVHFDNEVVTLLEEANLKLGELRGLGESMPNPALLIRPYLKRESISSSAIEGTQATMSDLLRYEASDGSTISEDEANRLRVKEVQNYASAFNQSYDTVKTTNRINLELITTAHKTLMTGVRGQEKNPGEFRKIQNWLGNDSKIENAVYVPPAPELINQRLLNFEMFLAHPPSNIPQLIQMSMIHYQFEAIHPFSDGNGRIGRLLLSLFLSYRKILPKPLLYLSAYFERNKSEYDYQLLKVSQEGSWNDWFRFFLHAMSVQTDETIKHINKLLDLRRQYEDQLRQQRTNSAFRLIDSLFVNPYVTINKAQELLGSSWPAAQRALEALVKAGIVKETNYLVRRSRFFVARDILTLLQ